ncbi:hypothetical protein IW261DRAFT_1418036 [Armillaria novae-zelandiae]|uniref:Uncharacterized protein n=1 Tax=Armillaria novae-zelandiae TaxID=153914 RepID=A0AA39UD97_9AGAR|nr:hypothetical protein IW261DRAFT_1418036 [Armillaria novae-zelandiae]
MFTSIALFVLLLFEADLALCSPILQPSIMQRDSISRIIQGTWQNPSDTLSILLIIGGDVVLKALAQLTGRSFTPIAFSFGWVSYSFNTLMSVLGDGRLVPAPDYPAKVINAENGYKRDNKSWVIGRLLRDFERPLADNVGLSITVFEAVEGDSAGRPSVDLWWYSGLVVIIIQHALAAIPCGLHKNWSILFITSAGTMLALITGSLPQWRREKWACRRKTKKICSVTGGNGTRHVMVILGKGVGLDLEDLAAAESPRMRQRGKDDNLEFRFTQVACLLLAILWIVFLITVTALKEDTWYLLGVGGLGMAQNVLVAGTERRIGTSGIHLKRIKGYEQEKVMDTLMDLEKDYPKVGKSLVTEFFPSGLREVETQWWAGSKEGYEKVRKEKRPYSLTSKQGPLVSNGF